MEPDAGERAVTALGSEAVVVEAGVLRTEVVMTVAQLYSILRNTNISVRLKGVEGSFTVKELEPKEIEDRIMVEVLCEDDTCTIRGAQGVGSSLWRDGDQ